MESFFFDRSHAIERVAMYVSWSVGRPFCPSIGPYSALGLFESLLSRGHATLLLAVSFGTSVGPSVTFLNSERFLLLYCSCFCSCSTVRDWIAVYPTLFFALLALLPLPKFQNCLSITMLLYMFIANSCISKFFTKPSCLKRIFTNLE